LSPRRTPKEEEKQTPPKKEAQTAIQVLPTDKLIEEKRKTEVTPLTKLSRIIASGSSDKIEEQSGEDDDSGN